MNKSSQIDLVEKIFVKTSNDCDNHKYESRSVSVPVMTILRNEKLANEQSYESILEVLSQQLITCFSLAIISVFCSYLYFSSNAYDDKMIDVLSTNNETELYSGWEAF